MATDRSIKVVVPISGGKDSQACLKLALLNYAPDEVRGLFCDTQFEHPSTYAHVDWIALHYGIQIDRVCEGSVPEKVLKYGRFPGGGSRHCTDELKLRPTRKYLRALAGRVGRGFEVWYGMRSAESGERKTRYAGKVCAEVYHPHEVLPQKYPRYLGEMGVRFRLAILDWSTPDVLEFLGGEQSPLYAEGFDRVGCFPCLAAGDATKERAFAHDDFGRNQRVITMKLAEQIGKSPFTSKGGMARNPMCGLFCGD